jgi:stage II sporulation protein P
MRSRKTVNAYIKKYPKIKVALDIHRDAIGDDNFKVKPTFTYKGKKGAQIMILSGYDPDGFFDFPNWNYNLRFALKLQQKCETNYSGMTRPMDFGNFAYNMNINTGSLLVEFGTDSNTLAEAVYSGKLFGKALAQVLQNKT